MINLFYKYAYKYRLVIIAFICVIAAGAVYAAVNAGKKPTEMLVVSRSAEITEAAEPSGDTIKVYVTGEVINPGVYELSSGSRIDDALKVAGGATEEADLLRINLAAYVKDAQQIIIPGKSADGAGNYYTEAESDGLIDINAANETELTALPGVGPVTAGNIVRYREEHGPFKKIEDIMNVTRIGQKTFDGMKDRIKAE